MADAKRYLSEVMTPGRFGRSGDAGVVLGERSLGTLIQVSTWPGQSSVPAGIAAAPRSSPFGAMAMAGDVEVYRVAPERTWLRAPGGGAIEPIPAGDTVGGIATLDISGSRVVITVEGPAVEDLMARLVTIDCSAAVFSPGRFAQTGLHEVSVFVVRRGEVAFEIWVPVTWSVSLWAYICEAAAPIGYEVMAV